MLLNIDEREPASVEIEEESQVLLLRLKGETVETRQTLLDLPMGELMIKLESLPAESSFQVKTPTAVAAARGTRFSVKVEALD